MIDRDRETKRERESNLLQNTRVKGGRETEKWAKTTFF